MKVSTAMVTSSMVIFCGASIHMTWSSENKYCHNVGTIPNFFGPSIFKMPACEKKSFGGGHFVLIISPNSHGTSLHPQQQEEQHLGNFPKAVPEYREESSQLAHLP